MFNVQSHANQEYRSSSGPRSIPDAKRYARMAFSAANQSACGDPSGLLFPSAVREFLDQFMTILSIKIGQWPGPLRQWLDLCCHRHTPDVFARFTLKSVIRLIQLTAFRVLLLWRSARLAMKSRAPPPQYVLPKFRRRQRAHPTCRSAACPVPR